MLKNILFNASFISGLALCMHFWINPIARLSFFVVMAIATYRLMIWVHSDDSKKENHYLKEFIYAKINSCTRIPCCTTRRHD